MFKKILVADDSAAQRAPVRSLLRRLDQTVSIAKDGRQAFAKLSQDEDIDCFRTAASLQKLSGLNILRTLSTDTRLDIINKLSCVVLTTTNITPEIRQHCAILLDRCTNMAVHLVTGVNELEFWSAKLSGEPIEQYEERF